MNKWSLVQFDRNCVNTETIRPDSNINTLWHESNYVYIIDSNDSNYAKADNRDESEKQKWGFEALSTLTSIGSVEVYVRHKTDGPERTDPIVNVKIGGSWRTGQSISQESDFTSVSKIWRGSWTASDFDNFEVGITAPDDMHKQAEFQVAEVYAVVGGPVTPSVTGVVTYEGLCNTPPLFYGIWGDSSNCDCCQ